jgi:tRNA threonylcarbamoyladenosine biosynthesis protein TsaB
MMRVLAIDTSTSRANVALLEGAGSSVETVAEAAATMIGSHATHLFDLIDRVMAAAAWSKSRLDAFAVIRGPGSFTGVRIALGTAQGLALASDRPCVGVNTLEAMAEASGICPAERTPVLGAGRGELYVARYDARSSPPSELVAPHLQTAEAFWKMTPGYPLWGSGAEPPAELSTNIGRQAGDQTAVAAGKIAILRGLRVLPDLPISPLYIRPPDAQLKQHRR